MQFTVPPPPPPNAFGLSASKAVIPPKITELSSSPVATEAADTTVASHDGSDTGIVVSKNAFACIPRSKILHNLPFELCSKNYSNKLEIFQWLYWYWLFFAVLSCLFALSIIITWQCLDNCDNERSTNIAL